MLLVMLDELVCRTLPGVSSCTGWLPLVFLASGELEARGVAAAGILG